MTNIDFMKRAILLSIDNIKNNGGYTKKNVFLKILF